MCGLRVAPQRRRLPHQLPMQRCWSQARRRASVCTALQPCLLTYLRIMLQRLSTLSGGLRAVGGPRAALPALARHVRMYGFGSHVSDNGEAWQGSAARCPNPARLQARP